MKDRSLPAGTATVLAALLPLSLGACASLGGGGGAPESSAEDRAVAERVLSSTPLIDGHNDLPWQIREEASPPGSAAAYDLRVRTPGHTDIERLRQGMLGGQFWSVYVSCEARDENAVKVQLEQIDIARQVVDGYPDVFEWAHTAQAMREAFDEGQVGSTLGMEGGHAIANSLGALRAFHDLGVRYMTLTHNCHTDWADAASEPPVHGGLTGFGREVVREMNRLGMLVDLSHTSPETMHEALDVSEAPVIWSHAAARGVVDHARNVPDDVLRRLPENGGVVMVTFVPSFVSESGVATIADVADHIEHVREVAGVDHVGIGGDFDGITEVVEGLGDVSTYPALFAELARRGWTEAELAQLAGENILRVMRRSEEVARSLQRQRPPSTARIR